MASVSDHTWAASCSISCFGLSCGCSSPQECLEDEYDIDHARKYYAAGGVNDNVIEDATTAVYMGDMGDTLNREQYL